MIQSSQGLHRKNVPVVTAVQDKLRHRLFRPQPIELIGTSSHPEDEVPGLARCCPRPSGIAEGYSDARTCLETRLPEPVLWPHAYLMARVTGTMLSKTDPAKTYLGQE